MLGALVFALMMSCASKKEQKKAEVNAELQVPVQTDTLLFYRKTSCMGTCPVYDFTLYHDRTCHINGKYHFKVKGEKRGKVSEETLAELQGKLESIDFWALEAKYDDEMVQDIPATYIYSKANGKVKWVKSRYGTPEKLKQFQGMVEAVIEQIEWK